MKNQKNERGITLVALVVTIVVLLILAGITIMYVMSDNGIFGKAQTAKTNTNKGVISEAVSVILGDLYGEIYVPSKDAEGNPKTLSSVFTTSLPSNMHIVGEGGGAGTLTMTDNITSADALEFSCYIKYDVDGLVYEVTYSKTAGLTVGDGVKPTT